MNKLFIAGLGGRIFSCTLRALAARGQLDKVVGVSASGDKDFHRQAEKLDYDSTHRAFPYAVRFVEPAIKHGGPLRGFFTFSTVWRSETGLPLHNYDDESEDNYLFQLEHRIPVFAEGNPSKLPLKQLGVDVAIDATGKFLTREKATAFLVGGAKKVIMSAPAKDDTPLVIHGINDEVDAGLDIVSRASCTTTCAAPIVKALGDVFGMPKHIILNTTHAVTNSQLSLDGNAAKFANGFGCMDNIVVTDTGATKSLQKMFPEIQQTYGLSCRVPVTDGSILQLMMEFEPTDRALTRDNVITALREFERRRPLNLRVSHRDTLVSTYLVGRPEGSIVTPAKVMVMGNLVTIVAGYDNEYGYSYLLAKSALDAPLPA